jgi:hypothetical protein
MDPLRFRTALPLVALALLVPTAAQAATVAVDRSCYRPGQQGTITGAGYTPGALVNFTLDGSAFGDTTADAAGNLVPATFTAGNVPGKQQQKSLTATDSANAANTATTTFTGTNLDVVVKPRQGNPGRKKKIAARGFDQGRNLWAHVRGPRKRNIKIGKVKGACGKLKKKKRIFKAGYPVGVYTVQFDQRKKYNAATEPRVTFSVTIFNVVRSSGAFASLAAPTEIWRRR